jgi:uncharacterized protein (DUF362 family)
MSAKAVVAIVKTDPQPDAEAVEKAVRKAVALAGGLAAVVKPGNLVIVKPNLVFDPITSDGELVAGACTSAEVCRAIARLVKELDATPVVADSATVGHDTESAIRRLGYDKLREEGIEVLDLKRGQKEVTVECPKGKVFKDMTTWEIVVRADVIISVPVMKTHDQAEATLGLKNLKGLYTDAMKKRAHTTNLFQQVADWATVVKPGMTVVDGIVGQEGAGPNFGIPVEMDLIIAGTDPVATDAVTSTVMGFEPEKLLITSYAAEHGLGTMDLAEIQVAGEPIEKVCRRFLRVIEDPRVLVPNLRVIHAENTCTGCRLCFHVTLMELTKNGFADKVAGYVALTGSGALPSDIDPSYLITIGRCVPMSNRIGKAHVGGCPPNGLPIMRALLGEDPEFQAFARDRGGLDF